MAARPSFGPARARSSVRSSRSCRAPGSRRRNVTDRTVGIIGLGIMGGAIARNLVERGWSVVGFDTEPARRHELALAGVTIADGVSAVVSRTPVIMTSLPNADAAHAVATEIAACGEPALDVI